MAGKKAIAKDFSFLFKRKDVLAILLYGSTAKGEQIEGSDIDICIVAPECRDKLELVRKIYRNLDVYGKNYDVKIFEEMPLYIKSQIIETNKVIFTGAQAKTQASLVGYVVRKRCREEKRSFSFENQKIKVPFSQIW